MKQLTLEIDDSIYDKIHWFLSVFPKDKLLVKEENITDTKNNWDNLSDDEKQDISIGINDLENNRFKDVKQVLLKYE